jgi:uncharacterized delta-60 repeat protein
METTPVVPRTRTSALVLSKANARARLRRAMLMAARPRLLLLSALAAVCVGLASALPAHAASGDLDPSFGSGGKVTTDFGSPVDEGNGVVIQPDGKVVVAGLKGGTEWDFALARYNTDGSLDTTFGSGGKVITNLGDYVDQAFDVALQSDGKIVAAGWSGNDVAVARYNSDGSLDTGFGAGGKATADFGGYPDYALGVAVQPDGKIVTVGGASDFAVARFNSDGSLDTGFGSGGKTTTDFGSSEEQANGVALLASGDVVAGGYSDQGATGDDFALAVYNSDGTLDTGFSSDGKLTTDFASATDQATGLAVQTDGKIVASGYSDQGATGTDFALGRYNPDGTLDTGFGSGGKVTTDFGSLVDQTTAPGNGVAIQPNGNIVAAGYSNQGATATDFALANYNPDGTLDTSFSSDGKVATDFASGIDVASGIVIQSDGNIVAAGYSSQGATGNDFALARYLGASDTDGDGVEDSTDNCPSDPNPDQTDNDGDGVGTACDNEELPSNKDQCKNNGWKLWFFGDGRRFKSQGDCVSYLATKRTNGLSG